MCMQKYTFQCKALYFHFPNFVQSKNPSAVIGLQEQNYKLRIESCLFSHSEYTLNFMFYL